MKKNIKIYYSFIVLLIIVIIAYLVLNKIKAEEVTSSGQISGLFLSESGQGIPGRITIFSPDFSISVDVDEQGRFYIDGIDKDVTAQVSFISSDGYKLISPNQELNFYTLSPGKNIVIQGWVATDRIIPEELTNDSVPPVITINDVNTSDNKIEFNVSDNTTNLSFATALYYRSSPENGWELSELSNEGSHYIATIPQEYFYASSQVEYYISSSDSSGNTGWFPSQGGDNPEKIITHPQAILYITEGKIIEKKKKPSNPDKPIAGATVTLTDAQGKSYNAQSNASGIFSLSSPAGTYKVVISHPQYKTKTTSNTTVPTQDRLCSVSSCLTVQMTPK